MKATSVHRRPRAPRRPAAAVGFAVIWHLAWAVVGAAGAAVLRARGLAGDAEVAALTAVVLPGLLGAALACAGDKAQRFSLVIWMFGSMAACLLTGGAGGPLAALCLAPLAAATAFRKPDLLPLGAAAALASAAVGALSALLLSLPAPASEAAPWLALLSLGGGALAMGAGLIALHVQVRLETRRRDSLEEELIAFLDHQPQLLLDLYPGGRILKIYGGPPPGASTYDLVGQNLGDLALADDRPEVDAAIEEAAAKGAALVRFRPSADADGWWELRLRRIGEAKILGAVRDAGVERTLAAEREAAEQQSQAKSRFLANMSHELRTPLNAIMGFSDIMRQRLFGPMSDRYADYAELVHESGAHLLELINDVLDMSKIEAERFELAREALDPREPVSAALRLMRGQADRAGVTLRGVLPAEALTADADRRALKQICINLLSNALKFTPRDGSVTLTLQEAGGTLELIVADTGVGIGREDLARLGKPFEQAGDAAQKAAGSGLGLSLVRAFAQLHGGEMSIESALGEGTTVIVRLPILVSSTPSSVSLAAQG